jgi:SAM-dependent methyltransferase
VTSPLSPYAKVAMEHARDRHGIELNFTSIASLDEILDRERSTLELEELESLVLCYGAWFGEWLIEKKAGTWVGFDEPVPPRIRIGNRHYSPLDAVRRRLLSKEAATLSEITKATLKTSKAVSLNIDYLEQNRNAWNALTKDERFVIDEFEPTLEEARSRLEPWLKQESDWNQRNVLCLAAGGGRHGPTLAQLGASVTVVDISPAQLEIDKQIAKKCNLEITTVVGSIDHLEMLDDASFDYVLQPVSSCYLPDCFSVYQQVARVIKPQGLYLVQHKQPLSLQASFLPSMDFYRIEQPMEEGRPLNLSDSSSPYREAGTQEFIHSLESLIGGLCRSGFSIEDFTEPIREDVWAKPGSPEQRARFIRPYLKIKARRLA